MEKLSARKRGAIVGDYLTALSYSEIAAKHHVSTGTVANVVADLKAGRFPEAGEVGEQIEQLKELSLDLKRANLTPGKCAVGLMVLARINECGLDPADINRWPLILKSIANEDEAQQFVELIYSIQEVQKRTGLSIDALHDEVHELEKKAAELEPMSDKVADCKKQIVELTRQQKELASMVASLEEKYKLLNPQVKDLEKREQESSRRIKDMEPRADKAEKTLTALSNAKQELQDTGLSLEALAEFNQRLKSISQRHNIAAAGLKGRLLEELEKLDQAVGLETLIQTGQLKLKEHERAVALARQERESLIAAVASLEQEKASLETTIRETREKVASEIRGIVPMTSDVIDRLLKELRRGHDEALGQLKEQEAEHNKVVAALRAEEAGIKASIQEAAERGRKLIQVMQGETLSAVKKATQDLAKEIEDWGDARSELGGYLEDLKRARYFTKLPMTRQGLDSFVDDIGPLIVTQYLQIAALWCSKNLSHKVRPPRWVLRKHYNIGEYTDVEVADLIRWAFEAFGQWEGASERRA